MYIERFLETEILEYIKKREIIAIIGPRQSGKTTLLQHIYKKLKNTHYITFEDRETLELFNEDIKSFIDLHIEPYDNVFIDEFQYAKRGGKQLKFIYDTKKTKIFISGSSATELSIQSIKYLVGRIFIFYLYPCSFEEFLNYKNPEIYKIYRKRKPSTQIIEKILPFFKEFCIFGGYPRVILSKNKEEKEIVLKNIYNTYFLKEIKEILNLKEDHKLSKLLHALALQISNIINYNELSEISNFRYEELLNNINILEKTFICLRAKPFYTNKRTELVKAPKIFFYDNGFRNIVIKNFQPITRRSDKGELYENFAATELLKQEKEIRYWRTKSKAEVDFIIEKNGNIIPIEVKSEMKSPKTTKSFQSFNEKYKPKRRIVLSEYLEGKKSNINYHPIFTIKKILDEN